MIVLNSWRVIDNFVLDTNGHMIGSLEDLYEYLLAYGIRLGCVDSAKPNETTWRAFPELSNFVGPSNIWVALKFDNPEQEFLFKLRYG